MVTNNALNIPTAAVGKVLQGGGVGSNFAFSTATYPGTSGTSGNVLTSDGTNWTSTIPTVTSVQNTVTSGAVYYDTIIPHTATVVMISFLGVSLSGTNGILIQLAGSGAVEGSGYAGITTNFTINGNWSAACFVTAGTLAASDAWNGRWVLTLQNPSTNSWLFDGNVIESAGAKWWFGSGHKALTGALTTVRVATTSGDTFDAGSITVTSLT